MSEKIPRTTTLQYCIIFRVRMCAWVVMFSCTLFRFRTDKKAIMINSKKNGIKGETGQRVPNM
jgi:hypothetical protein